jgi:hypothetical protein
MVKRYELINQEENIGEDKEAWGIIIRVVFLRAEKKIPFRTEKEYRLPTNPVTTVST